eukprot:13107313-Alexandrium_andersonii.AAC.1
MYAKYTSYLVCSFTSSFRRAFASMGLRDGAARRQAMEAARQSHDDDDDDDDEILHFRDERKPAPGASP